MKLGIETGSLVNFMMANPKFVNPEVGMNVTELHWTDRDAWQITSVDKDGKGCIITKYAPKYIGKGYGDEAYQYDDENGNPLLDEENYVHIRYHYKKWRVFSDGKYEYDMNLSFGVRETYRDPSF